MYIRLCTHKKIPKSISKYVKDLHSNRTKKSLNSNKITRDFGIIAVHI